MKLIFYERNSCRPGLSLKDEAKSWLRLARSNPHVLNRQEETILREAKARISHYNFLA